MHRICITLSFLFWMHPVFSQSEYNQTDASDRRHGVWRQYYPNSTQLRYEGTFHHGKETGTFKFYCPDCGDQPNVIKHFDLNSELTDVTFYEKGKRAAHGKMKDKDFVGKWIYYHKNSDKIMMEENYKDGVLHGKKSVFYPNGNLAEEIHYNKGIKEGANNYYAPDGTLLKNLNYHKNHLHGKAAYFDAKGNKISEGSYKNGLKNGLWRYYENGKPTKEEQFPKKH